MDKIKQNTNNGFLKQRPKITIYEPNNKQIRLVFKNRLNNEYEVIEEDITEIGIVDSYKSYIDRALNPNLDGSSGVYGVAKKLEPKTKTIQEMRNSIDNANSKLNELLNKQEQPKQEELKQEQTISNGGDN